jgi:hypothetical protein
MQLAQFILLLLLINQVLHLVEDAEAEKKFADGQQNQTGPDFMKSFRQ